MVNTDLVNGISLKAIRTKHRHVGEGETVMFVIVCEKRQRGILILYLCFEDCFVPGDHFIEASRHINHVGQFVRGCHSVSPFTWNFLYFIPNEDLQPVRVFVPIQLLDVEPDGFRAGLETSREIREKNKPGSLPFRNITFEYTSRLKYIASMKYISSMQ